MSNESDWTGVAGLLSKWLDRARTNQWQHYESAKHFDKLHNAIGIPAVMLSTIVGTTVFAALQKQLNFWVQVGVGAISIGREDKGTDGQCVGDRCEQCTKSGRAPEENLVGLAGEQAFSSL